MRLMLTVTELGVGGAERVVVELAGIAAQDGHEVAVAADRGAFDRLLPESVERIVTSTKSSSPPQIARAVAELRRAIRRFQPDVIHSHGVRATATTAIARRLALGAAPQLSTFHGVPIESYRNAARILRLVPLVVCVSSELEEALRNAGLPQDRTTVIRNSVSLAEPLSDAERSALDAELGLDGSPVISIVGRLVPQKAHRRFIDAARLIADDRPDVRFLVIGEGPLREELSRYADQRGLDDRLSFTGVRPDARALIARSDLLAFTSDWEGLSIAALEALAAGVPVVSTPAHGMSELLEDGGGLVTEGYSPTEFAATIGALLDDPAQRERMGEQGRELIAGEYSLARMGGEYLALYRRLAA